MLPNNMNLKSDVCGMCIDFSSMNLPFISALSPQNRTESNQF